jgi:hypothetical protein
MKPMPFGVSPALFDKDCDPSFFLKLSHDPLRNHQYEPFIGMFAQHPKENRHQSRARQPRKLLAPAYGKSDPVSPVC